MDMEEDEPRPLPRVATLISQPTKTSNSTLSKQVSKLFNY